MKGGQKMGHTDYKEDVVLLNLFIKLVSLHANIIVSANIIGHIIFVSLV